MYMVISMPHRKSNAAGVSHFMTLLLSFLVESGQGPFDKAPSKDLTLPAPWVDAIFRSAGAGRNRIIMKLTS